MSKEHKQVIKQFLIELTGGIAIVYAMLGLALLFGGCKTVERESVVVKSDTLHHYIERRDSVIYRDSVFVHLYERGDTVYHVTERWNVRYNDRVRVDTVYKVREVQAQSKEVAEKKEPWYDNFLTKVLLCLLAGAVLVGAIKMTNNKA